MNNVKELEVKIEGEKWTKAIDKAFNNKRKDLKVDGFRKGACPKDVYIKKFGIESLYMDAVDLVINDAYKKSIEDNKLDPVCEPKVDVSHIDDKGVSFKFTVVLHPEVKLGKYKGLGLKQEDVKVTAEEVEHEIGHLRDKFADIVEVTDGVVEDGNTAVINFKGVVDGKVLEGGTGENYPLEIGSNTFIPGFESGLVGMKIGDEKVLKLKFPEDYVDNLKGKDVEFTVKVLGIKKRILPELNESFYKDLGYDDIKDEKAFKEEVKNHLLEHKKADSENKYIDELLKKAADNLTVEINPEIVEDEVNRMINQYREQLKMQGLSLEQYLAFTKSDMESLKKMMEPEALNRIKSRYLLEAIADKEKITVTDDETKEEANKMAEHYNVTVEELINMIGGEDVVAYDLKMRKAIEVLKNN
jgi:trigger factor